MTTAIDPTRTPTLTEVIQAAIELRLASVHISLPARVESYDKTTQRCSAQPLVQRGYIAEDGTRQVERLPVVTDAPVLFHSGAAGSTTIDLAAGDLVTLMVASSSLDRYLAVGGEVDPGDDRKFTLSDCYVIPGGRDFAHALPSDAVADGAIVTRGSDIRLGSANASSPVALNADLAAFINIFVTGWTPVPMDGGAALKVAISAYLSGHTGFPIGATKVKAE